MGMAIRTSATIDQISRAMRAALVAKSIRRRVSTAVTPMDDCHPTSPSVFMRRFPLYLLSGVRADGAAARDRRDLRRGELLRRAAHARDGNSHGARRAAVEPCRVW